MARKQKYETVVTLNFPDGTKKRKHIRARTKKELNLKKFELMKEADSGFDPTGEGEDFRYWADKWYREVKEPSGISLGTLDMYQSTINVLNQELGDIKIRALTLSDFQCFINDYARENPHTGKPTSKRTLSFYKTVAKDICIYAQDNKQSVSNFYKAVIPKDAPKKERRALTPTEIDWIVETPHPMQLGAMIMLFAGLRLNELCTLRWSDIDLDAGWVHVQNFISFYHTDDNGKIQRREAQLKSEGKSKSAKRWVPIPPVLVSFLRQYIAEHGKKTMYVFVRPNGQLHTVGSVRSLWKRYINYLNRTRGFSIAVGETEEVPMVIEWFTPHYLRHTYATMLYWQGVDSIDAKSYMGHSDIKVTLDVYTDAKEYCRARLPDDMKQKLMTIYKVTGNEAEKCLNARI